MTVCIYTMTQSADTVAHCAHCANAHTVHTPSLLAKCNYASVNVYTTQQSQSQGVTMCHTTVAHCATTMGGGCLCLSLCAFLRRSDRRTVTAAHCVTQSHTASDTVCSVTVRLYVTVCGCVCTVTQSRSQRKMGVSLYRCVRFTR